MQHVSLLRMDIRFWSLGLDSEAGPPQERKLRDKNEFRIKDMKIAVPTRDGRVDDHFGHCAYYTIFDIVDGKVAGVSKMASPEGCGCKSGIAPVLRQMGVAVMLAGNMGQGAKNVLGAQRIEVIRGCSGDVEELVAAYLAGNIKDNGEICDHHNCH